ncbi:hypothetical protein FXO37_30152 [Capsicum annuum]|nr:hypothetical protein FXO37_30152 [Capsicum annuum]
MVKYQLVEYHSLPGYLKDNEFIRGHYLSEWPVKQALLSVFTIHNETLNVWTVIPLVGSEEGGVYAIFALPCDGREVVSDRSLTQEEEGDWTLIPNADIAVSFIHLMFQLIRTVVNQGYFGVPTELFTDKLFCNWVVTPVSNHLTELNCIAHGFAYELIPILDHWKEFWKAVTRLQEPQGFEDRVDCPGVNSRIQSQKKKKKKQRER